MEGKLVECKAYNTPELCVKGERRHAVSISTCSDALSLREHQSRSHPLDQNARPGQHLPTNAQPFMVVCSIPSPGSATLHLAFASRLNVERSATHHHPFNVCHHSRSTSRRVLAASFANELAVMRSR